MNDIRLEPKPKQYKQTKLEDFFQFPKKESNSTSDKPQSPFQTENTF